MEYPTRAQVEFAMREPDTLMYEKDSLEGVVFVAQQNMLKKIGGVLLAMHDALDAKQAELDKGRDLIKRMLELAKCGMPPRKVTEWLVEADTMTKEG